MTPGILILKTTSGSHAKELVDDIFGVDSFATGEELLVVYGDDEDHWFEPLAFTMTEQAFFRRFFGGGVSVSTEKEEPMVTMMENAKRIVHGAAAAVGLVDSPAEIARAKDREAKRELFAKLPEASEAMKKAAAELEAMNQRIAAGETFTGAARPLEVAYRNAARFYRTCQAARTVLIDNAPPELRIRRLRKKRELVSTQTRVNLLTRQQIPDAGKELAKLEEKAGEAAKLQSQFSGHQDPSTRLQTEDDARIAASEVFSLKADLEGLRDELTAATEKLAALQAELEQIDTDILTA